MEMCTKATGSIFVHGPKPAADSMTSCPGATSFAFALPDRDAIPSSETLGLHLDVTQDVMLVNVWDLNRIWIQSCSPSPDALQDVMIGIFDLKMDISVCQWPRVREV